MLQCFQINLLLCVRVCKQDKYFFNIAVSSVLQCVAACCSVLMCVALCCSVLQRAAAYFFNVAMSSVLQCL